MLKVKIKSIGRQNILSDEKFDWLLRRLDTPLPISCIDLDTDGNVLMMVIRTDEERFNVITLFVDSNEVIYEFVGDWPTRTNGR